MSAHAEQGREAMNLQNDTSVNSGPQHRSALFAGGRALARLWQFWSRR